MSKRSRRERRAGQQERALVTCDVAALGKLVEQGPRSAVAVVTRALASPPPDPTQAAELDALAVRLCKKLRQAGEPALALTVAAAGGRRTTALRREEALAAFCAGNDEVAAQLAAADEAIAAALGPLLQAVRGEVAAPSTAGPALRTLHAAARAVAHVVRGEGDRARGIVNHIPYVRRVAVLGDEIVAAAALQDPERAVTALLDLDESPRVPRASEVRRLMGAEAVLDLERMADLPPELAGHLHLVRRFLPARLATATSPGMVTEVIRQCGVDAFDAKELPAATLYLGYVQARPEPAAASLTFDRAVQLGADLVEALRGKLIAALVLAHDPRNDWEEEEQAMRQAARAADRLAHALERTAGGRVLAAVAGKMAARSWLYGGDAHAALASVTRARPAAGGKLLEELALLEIDALMERDPKEAERRLDAFLAASPGSVEAWNRKATLARSYGDLERARAIVLQAAEATKDPKLAASARSIRAEREHLAPFEGLVPGVATAGVLAREVWRTASEAEDPLPRAAALRDALALPARLAFDAAAVFIAVRQGRLDLAQERLRNAVLAWRGSPRDLARLAAVAILAGFGNGVVAASRVLTDGEDTPALAAIAEALAVAGEGKLVGRILPRIAADLPRDRVVMLKSLTGGARRAEIPGVADPTQAARELDLVLAPDFSIAEHAREGDQDAEEEAGDLFDSLAGGGPGLLGELLEALGIPAAAALAVPGERQRRLEDLLLAPGGTESPAALPMLLAILDELGIVPPPSFRPRARRRR